MECAASAEEMLMPLWMWHLDRLKAKQMWPLGVLLSLHERKSHRNLFFHTDSLSIITLKSHFNTAFAFAERNSPPFCHGPAFHSLVYTDVIIGKKVYCTVPRGCLVLTVIFHYAWCEGDNFQYATFIRIVFNMHFKIWILPLLGIYLHFSHSRQ